MDAQIRARLPDGHQVTLEFNGQDTLRVVYNKLQEHVGAGKFFIGTNYPKKMFTENEINTLTIQQAGLFPRGALICQDTPFSVGVQQGAGSLLTPGVIHVVGNTQYVKWKSTPNHLVVVDFSATWCPPCQQIKPVFENLAKQYGNEVVFLHVDVDQNRDCEDIGDVKGIPAFKLFKNKQLVDSFSGADANRLEQLIRRHK
eukprot:TRINITY_DN6766_c0_g1_i1.p2 TRINITY_DN6766_c0_g1~~TRINITY_DN6766_c0_g1_i1.p2  ORF type:complete len:200 (+),score=40.87 TRINITY_DN6766_c0_g1_i1:208-807(+)